MKLWIVMVFILCYLAGYPACYVLADEKAVYQEEYAYTSDTRVFIGGYGYYGAVTISGEYYIPLYLFGEQGYASYPGFTWYMTEDSYQIVYDPSVYPVASERKQISYQYRTKAGIPIGKADASEKKLIIKSIITDKESDFAETRDTIENGIYLLGGSEPYVKASAFEGITNLAIYEDERAIYLFYEKGKRTKRTYEKDLAGMLLLELEDGNDDRVWWITKISDCLQQLSKTEDAEKEKDEHFFNRCNRIISSNDFSEESYAFVFQTMCIRIGIPCDIIEGMREGEWHIWNRVFIENQWLYIDGDDFLLPAMLFAKNHWWPDEDCPNPLEEEIFEGE